MNTLSNSGTTFQVVYLIITVAAFIPSVTYAVRYHLKTKGAWKTHLLGRTLMMMVVMLSTLFAFIAFNTVWSVFFGPDSYPWRVPLGMILYTTFAGFMWVYWWAFEKTQRENDKKAGTRNVQ